MTKRFPWVDYYRMRQVDLKLHVYKKWEKEGRRSNFISLVRNGENAWGDGKNKLPQ